MLEPAFGLKALSRDSGPMGFLLLVIALALAFSSC